MIDLGWLNWPNESSFDGISAKIGNLSFSSSSDKGQQQIQPIVHSNILDYTRLSTVFGAVF